MSIPDVDLIAALSFEIGLDSLVLVDIRSCFPKNLHVSIPILKIIDDNTLKYNVQDAVETSPAELSPQRVDYIVRRKAYRAISKKNCPLRPKVPNTHFRNYTTA